jgi:putative membrane protein
MQLAVISAIVVAILGVAFAMQNNVPVTVNFLVWRFDSTLAMMLLIALALGAVIIALLTTPMTLQRQWKIASQKRRIQELENIVENQQNRIAELERHIPIESESKEPKSYVGLKQLILGRENLPSVENNSSNS